MKGHSFLCAAVIVCLAGGAMASDLPTHKPAPVFVPPTPAPFTWTGPSVGVLGGYSWDGEEIFTNTWSHGVGRSGGFGGLAAGYDYQINNIVVVGAEAEYNFSDIRGSVSPLPTYTLTTHVSSFGSVDGHLGLAFDRFQVYGLGGLALGSIQHSITLTGIETDNFSAFQTGYDWGGGIKYAFTNNWIVGAEYHAYSFGTEDFGAVGLLGPHHAKEHLSAVLFNVNYLFGN